jgi:hypothetical protein
VGNDGLWKAWKNGKTVFPPFPQTLEIDVADFHITTATTTTGISNISEQRQKKEEKQVPTTIGNYGCR